MKFDPKAKQNTGARRTLMQLNNAMHSLLIEKSVNDIKMQDIYDRSLIPKSTFYAYFEDKYDLLWYFLQCQKEAMTKDSGESISEEANSIYTFFEKNHKDIKKIFRLNPPGSDFQAVLYRFLRDFFEETARNSDSSGDGIPANLKGRINAFSFMLVMHWAYVEEGNIEREHIAKYMNYFCRL